MHAYGENGRPEYGGETWDYQLLAAGGEVTQQDLLNVLASLGMQGWELCTTLQMDGQPLLVFKRPRARGTELSAERALRRG